MAEPTVKQRRPLSYIRFSSPIILSGTGVPISTWEQGKQKSEWHSSYKSPQAWLDLDRDEVVIGSDIFPRSGGLIAQYRSARIATSAYPGEKKEPSVTGPAE